VCSLPDLEASQVLDRLRRESRPTLKANYLERRRFTERWLAAAAREVLGRTFGQPPVYFFLGDFSYMADASRPAALVLPLSSLPPSATTLTLGDSMSVAEVRERQVYTFRQMVALFADGETVRKFSYCDKAGFEARFIEAQVWERSWLPLECID
jgi:hypothetical protein